MAVGDASLAKVIRGNLDRHLVANRDLDEELPHLTRNMGEHLVPVVQLDLVHGGRENLRDGSRNLYRLVIVFCHAGKFTKNRSETQGVKLKLKQNPENMAFSGDCVSMVRLTGIEPKTPYFE